MLHPLAQNRIERAVMILRVPRAKAHVARRQLREAIDGSKVSRRAGPWVDFPLLMNPQGPLDSFGAMVREAEVTHAERFPREPIKRVLGFLELPPDLKALVPRRWERLGEVVVLRLPPMLRPNRSVIAEAFAKGLGASTVVEEVGPITGLERMPQVEVLYGDSTETVHRENGIRFKIDVGKVMFSSGNMEERIRMAQVGKVGEVVVDLFAGVGYFTLPLAVHGRANVYACEISPTASDFLRSNVSLNDVEDRVAVLEGDCRRVAPRGIADRVVLGYLWNGPLFLPTALEALGAKGVLHYHQLVKTSDPWRAWREVTSAALAGGRKVHLVRRRRVKSYGPGRHHVVLDVAVSRQA